MIIPRRPSGFNELLPADQLAFNAMISVIKLAYEQFGYAPIETPALELAEVLLAKEGGETAKQGYRFTKGDTDLAMRFDLTIPLARYVSEHYHELSFPFRRYQIQEVWRGEKPQAGRYRQFYQCDVDIIGSSSMLADAEVLLTAHDVFKKLDLPTTLLCISHRGILGGWFEAKKLTRYATEAMRALDKLDKIGEKKVAELLIASGLKKPEAQEVLRLAAIKGSAAEVIKAFKAVGIHNEKFERALKEIAELDQYLKAGGLKKSDYIFDTKIIRGLDYYTGMVFETLLKKNPEVGSICSGGRYDNLVGHYRKEALPGVGSSIGLSRLFSAIKGKISNSLSSPAQVVVLPFEQNVADYGLKAAETLRRAGLNVFVYPGFEKIGKQLGYADKLGIHFAVLIGSYEKDKNMVTIKNMKSGDQKQIKLDKAATFIKKSL